MRQGAFSDPIVDEVRAIREAYADSLGRSGRDCG